MRGQTLLFQISPNSAAFNGFYGEAVQPRPGYPALHQALTITVGINPAVSGTGLGLSADLVDASSNPVAHKHDSAECRHGHKYSGPALPRV
jgi:hypothetical protein